MIEKESNYQPNEPDAVMFITDLAAHKAITDPLRLQIIELVLNQPQTVKQIAKKIDRPPTKLYYHVNMLEKHNLIRVVDTKIVSGILEKWYRTTAYLYRIDRTLLSLTDPQKSDAFDNYLSTTFDTSKDEIKKQARLGHIDLSDKPTPHRALRLARLKSSMTQAQVKTFYERLDALIAEFEALPAQSTQALTNSYSLFVAYYPNDKENQGENDE